jgi:hypothetical protein
MCLNLQKKQALLMHGLADMAKNRGKSQTIGQTIRPDPCFIG